MAPEQTATYLINKFYHLRAFEVMEPEQRTIAYDTAKRSAIIAVHEIMDVLESIGRNDSARILLSYYQQVKQIIIQPNTETV